MGILCATDLLPKSEAAVERAGMMARRLGARLGIVHVLSSERDERKATRALAQMEKRFRATLGNEGIAPSVILRSGNLASQLTRVVLRIAPDLLVLGPRRRGTVRDRLGETLAEGILSAHRCPLLIVKHCAAGDYRNILLALDLSPAAEEILRTAQSIVWESAVNTSVVHALSPTMGYFPTFRGQFKASVLPKVLKELRRSGRYGAFSKITAIGSPTAASSSLRLSPLKRLLTPSCECNQTYW
jgi:universal stress protein E